MARQYSKRRFFKQTEISLMKQLAAEGKSQSYVAQLLDRSPGVVAGAAIRYGIQFSAPPGTPVRADPEDKRRRKAEACRRRRARRGAKSMPQMARRQRPEQPVTRFDDPRVVVQEER